MSIAAAIKCNDGIVLCADIQETIDQYFKVHKPKLIELPLVSPDLKAVVVGAGDSMFMDVLVEQISEKIDLAIPNSGSVQKAVDDAVKNVCSSNWPLYATQNDRPQARLLIGLKAVDGLFLFDVATPLVREADRYTFIGCGYDLALYKAKQMFRPQIPVEMSTKLLIHILDIVKENVEFCGGDTHVAIITTDGVVDHKTQEYVGLATKGYQSFARIVDYISPVLSVLESPEGKNFLTVMSELPIHDPDLIKQFEATLIDLSNKTPQQIMDDPRMVMARLSQKLALSVAVLQEVSTTFHDRGWATADTQRQVQTVFGDCAREGKAANEALKGGDLDKARERLLSVLSRLSASSSLLLTAEKSSDQQ